MPFGAWLSLPLDYPCTNMTLQPTARRAEDLQQRSQHGWGLGRMQSLRLQGSTDSRLNAQYINPLVVVFLILIVGVIDSGLSCKRSKKHHQPTFGQVYTTAHIEPVYTTVANRMHQCTHRGVKGLDACLQSTVNSQQPTVNSVLLISVNSRINSVDR